MKLGNPKNTIEVIQKYDFDFQKKFGQNFLIDERVLEKIISAAEVNKEDFVLEIGPGIGTMTQYLAENAREVMAVEIDKNLIPILSDTLSAYDNVSILNADILKVDIAKIVEEKNGGKPVKVVANLPYYITTPIIMGLFESHVPIDSITVMVQKEVADRMQSGPGTKDYGALSLAVQYYAEPYVVANVPPNCFMPRPKVGSAVIRLDRYGEPPVQVDDEKLMFHIIRASFNQRRKTLANGLSNAPQVHLSKEEIQECIAELGEPLTIRGFTEFHLNDFRAFYPAILIYQNFCRVLEQIKDHALFFCMMYFLHTRRKLFLATAVYDMYLRAKSLCSSRSIHSNVTAADNDNFLACFDRCIILIFKCLHQVVSGQELICRKYAHCLLARNTHKSWKSGTGTDKYGLKSLVFH